MPGMIAPIVPQIPLATQAKEDGPSSAAANAVPLQYD